MEILLFKGIRAARNVLFFFINMTYAVILLRMLNAAGAELILQEIFHVIIWLLLLILLIKHFKNIKYIFKIDEKHKIKDILIIFLQALFTIAASVIFLLSLLLISSFKNMPKQNFDAPSVKAYNILYKQMQAYKPAYNNLSGFENSFFEGLNLNEKHQTPDGIIYSVIKFQNECRVINTEDYKKSDCLIEADVNGFKKPNKPHKDKTIFIIDGINNKIIPSKQARKRIDNYYNYNLNTDEAGL